MADLFISTLEKPLQPWCQAFADLVMLAELPVMSSRQVVEDDNGPAIVWLHIQEQTQDWLKQMLEKIRAYYPRSRVIVLANQPKINEDLFALGLGAGAYVHAYTNESTLIEIKNVVLHGGAWLSTELLQRLIVASTQLVHYDAQASGKDLLELLTQREQEVALEAAKGLSNKEIARLLNITERTVKAHLSSVFERLNIKDRLHLALVIRGQSVSRPIPLELVAQKNPPPNLTISLQ